ncbi:hypothetical protein CONCODRAFT_86679 [Conidiobolus coronatus NRRL 28638]|uniref:GATA-type domain-containing protein n=1 Tax=Conidiobolus coronatus (strain ATCC 28846 / CBS 209.66 / NRRL 28638) TaxID=796925 RepID=A0A137NZ41_CONC2|nr:hypothetical protein CONCODRAFT_86679 [Conidiobolus coronatus NRRL 28638]|eukprot:KXN68002.1 hypothetical protein CONCODRAFT_86679 [Conidiobolus coronatus NRRL 28638]
MSQLSPAHSVGDSIELVTPSDSSIDSSLDHISKIENSLCHIQIPIQQEICFTTDRKPLANSSQYLDHIQKQPDQVSQHHPWWTLNNSSSLYQLLLSSTILRHDVYSAKRSARPKNDLITDHEEKKKIKISKLQNLIKSKSVSISERKHYIKVLHTLDPQAVPSLKPNKQYRRDNRNNKGQFKSGHPQFSHRSQILSMNSDSSIDLDSDRHSLSHYKGGSTARRFSSSSKKLSKLHKKPSSSSVNLQRRSTPSDDENRPPKQCASCGTKYSPAWRPSIEHGLMLCNSCGLRLKKTNQFCNICLYIPLKVELVGKRKDKIGVCKKCHHDHSQSDGIKKHKIMDGIMKHKQGDSLLCHSFGHKLQDDDHSNNHSETVSQLPSPEHV